MPITGIFLFLLISNCAKVGSPSGGPKDVTPPVIVKSTPKNFKKNYKGDRFELTFNEFVSIKDLSNELIISPPLEERTTYKLRGKTFIFDLNNKLRDSTTYTFNFGNSIVDFNEGNPLANFEFVVSTGNILDSLSLTGNLVEAKDLVPMKDPVLVMLFSDLNDSAPLLEIPAYVGRTQKNGDFAINNIKTGTYKIFALKDANRDMIYDLPDEAIAFIDSAFNFDPTITNFKENIEIDTSLISEFVDSTMFTDSLMTSFVIDSLTGDTIKIPQKKIYALHVNLLMFTEETKIQYITEKLREEKGKIVIEFNRPQFDSVHITPLNFDDKPGLILKENSKFNDTITLWITDTTIANLDTLDWKVSYTALDTLNQPVTVTDTLILKYKEKKVAKPPNRRGRKEETEVEKTPVLNLRINISNNSKMDLNRPIVINAERPILQFNIDSIRLYQIVDSVESPVDFDLMKDTLRLHKFAFHVKWDEEAKYRLFIAPQAFTDIYGETNDTIDLTFTTQVLDYYGQINLTTGSENTHFLIQLLDSKDKVIRTKTIDNSEIVVFDYLVPATYRIKAILDTNKNGKWDTGNYLKKIQPEKVFFYPDQVEVRSNWVVDLTWNIK